MLLNRLGALALAGLYWHAGASARAPESSADQLVDSILSDLAAGRLIGLTGLPRVAA